MKTPKFVFVNLFLFASSCLMGQNLNPNWNTELNNSLQQFLSCQGGSQSCAKFIGESLNTVYKVNDFYSAKSGRYMLPGEIASFLKETKQWKMIGPSYDQKVLVQAQDLANSKKAVVAVYMNESGIGHVVVIVPGQLERSGSWSLDVPNAASFFPMEPDKSFVGKGLSFAFTKTMLKDVLIYSRN